MPPKTVSVTGFKNSGKTSVVEALVRELSSRGRRVGTLKHTADDIDLDTPGKDTRRHRDAGSVATGILQESTTALFIDEKLSIHQAAEKLGAIDYLVIEGFKTVDTHARIIVPRDNGDIELLSNGLEIATVRIPESRYTGEALTLDDAAKITDIVEERTLEKGFVVSKFRESRDESGKLTYATGEDRIELIRGMPVYNTDTDQDEKL